VRLSIFGSGYVGLVTGACLADVGNDVLCVDVDLDKVSRLQAGEVPIHEPGLDAVIARNMRAGRLRFSGSAAEGVVHGEAIMIAVGTPPDEDGSADLSHVLAVARSIGKHLPGYRVVIDKSTVPVGTADRVRETIQEELALRGERIDFDVVSNPEFLKEGAAVADFMKPDRVVVGTDSPQALDLMRQLYEPFTRSRERLVVMDVRSAELTKYAANAMLATRISFMNELSGIAERVGADIERVRQGIGSDSRIGYAFIYPGAGYGGSCFPKDVQALRRTAEKAGATAALLAAVEDTNDRQKRVLFERISEFFGGELRGRTIALWGLAFKPNTDDMRAASSRVLMQALWAAGAAVRAYDPVAMSEAARLYPAEVASGSLVLVERAMTALEGASALVVVTEWQEFRSPDFETIRGTLRVPVIFDGRNVYDPAFMRRLGIRYFGIGRGESVRDTIGGENGP
jgi:UDPglucose 6-dehydrogenase